MNGGGGEEFSGVEACKGAAGCQSVTCLKNHPSYQDSHTVASFLVDHISAIHTEVFCITTDHQQPLALFLAFWFGLALKGGQLTDATDLNRAAINSYSS